MDSVVRARKVQQDARTPAGPISPAEIGNETLRQKIESGQPFLFGRLGTTEAGVLGWRLRFRQGVNLPFPQDARFSAWNNGGFFPPTDPNLDRLADEFARAVRLSDLMIGWNTDHERLIRHRLNPDIPWVALRSVEPYYSDEPWSQALAGKRVLVVHPFAEQILRNYRDLRTKLFANPKVLPEFHLEVVRTEQTLAGNTAGYASWFEIRDKLRAEILSKDFDVAILGCGSYGMPLAADIRLAGRSAIYFGGALQILFGIKGKRWENHEVISKLFNEHWNNVDESLIPSNRTAVEGGCYW